MATTPTATPSAKVEKGLVTVKATDPIKHDGQYYDVGDELPPMPKDQAEALIALGSAAKA